MGLYDNYNAINSTGVRQYQGSAMPEMVAVSDELQKRYDTVQNTLDYAYQYLNGLQSDTNPQNQAALTAMKQKYKDALGQIASRPDLENMTRETTRLAQQLPQDYAPFAANLQRQQDFKKQQDDAVQLFNTSGGEKGTRPDQGRDLVAANIGAYNAKPGMQINPATGKLEANFAPEVSALPAVDPSLMDKAFKDAKEISYKGLVDVQKGEDGKEQWVFRDGSLSDVDINGNPKPGTKLSAWQGMTHDRAIKIMQDYLQNHPVWNTYLQGKQYIDAAGLNTQGLSLEDASKLRNSRYAKTAQDETAKMIQYGLDKYVHIDKDQEHQIASHTNSPTVPTEKYTDAITGPGMAVPIEGIAKNLDDTNVSIATLQNQIDDQRKLASDSNSTQAVKNEAYAKIDGYKAQLSAVKNNLSIATDYALNKGKAEIAPLQAQFNELNKITHGYSDINKIPASEKAAILAQPELQATRGGVKMGAAMSQAQMLQMKAEQAQRLADKINDIKKGYQKEWFKEGKGLITSYTPNYITPPVNEHGEMTNDHMNTMQKLLNHGNPAVTIIGPDGKIVTDPKQIAKVTSHIKLSGLDDAGDGYYQGSLEGMYTPDGKPDPENGYKYTIKMLGGNYREDAANSLINQGTDSKTGVITNPHLVNSGVKMLHNQYLSRLEGLTEGDMNGNTAGEVFYVGPNKTPIIARYNAAIRNGEKNHSYDFYDMNNEKMKIDSDNRGTMKDMSYPSIQDAGMGLALLHSQLMEKEHATR